MKEKFAVLEENVKQRCLILQTKWLKEKWIRKSFFILVVLYLIALSALFRANYNYIDDSGRALDGYRGWDNWSRYISNILSVFVHADSKLTDISPLPQLLAVFIMAFSGLILIYLFSRRKQISFIQLLAVLPLGLNPWFLECFSYKFDSPYMALSILFSIIPFLWWKNKKQFIIASLIGILVMDMTYQASSGIYIMLTFALVFQEWVKGTPLGTVMKKVLLAVINYGAAMLIFRIFFMKKSTDYVSTQMASFVQMPQVVIQNLTHYLIIVQSDLSRTELVLIAFILVAFCGLTIIHSERNKIKTICAAILLVLLETVFSYGGYLALQNPLFAPRAMYGFGIFLTIIMVMGVTYNHNNIWIKAGVILLVWCMVTFTLTYGNALAEQKRYTDFRIQMVLEDYNHLTQGNRQKERWIQLDGNIGKTESIHRMEQRNPALKRLIPSTFGQEWYWNKHRFFHYFNLKSKPWDEKKQDMKTMNLPVIMDTEYHKIQSDGTHILITLYE